MPYRENRNLRPPFENKYSSFPETEIADLEATYETLKAQCEQLQIERETLMNLHNNEASEAKNPEQNRAEIDKIERIRIDLKVMNFILRNAEIAYLEALATSLDNKLQSLKNNEGDDVDSRQSAEYQQTKVIVTKTRYRIKELYALTDKEETEMYKDMVFEYDLDHRRTKNNLTATDPNSEILH